MYDPYTGTFTQPDPIQGGGATPYGYTSGDPINHLDLTGNIEDIPDAGGGGINEAYIGATASGDAAGVDLGLGVRRVAGTSSEDDGATDSTAYADRRRRRGRLFRSQGDFGAAVNRFFRDATSKCTDFRSTALSDGTTRLEFYAPANNPGYGKLYVQDLDAKGDIVQEYKDNFGPEGRGERKWVHPPKG